MKERSVLWPRKPVLGKHMSELSASLSKLPPEQEAIRAKCFHPSGTFVEFSKEDVETSIPARFEKIVLRHPDRLAVKVGKRALTYDDLNRAANRIARTILALTGQGSEPIALLFEHGIDVIATILGVLKAGKFYVALGFSFPPERNQYMLNDSQARLIVTNGRHFEPASSLASDVCTVLNIELLDDALASENIGCYALPDDLAAIRYTSGSTGEPKGIAESHRKILHQARLTTNDELHICAEDRLTLLHSVSFGSAYPHLYGSLLNGACLLPFDIKSEGIHRLVSWIKDEEITIFKSPPPVFRQLAELLEVEAKFPALRLIHLSGAPITQPDFDLYKNRFAAGPLLEISMGATEVRGICFALLDQSFSFPQVGSPIGYPRSGRQILLLNESGLEVEPGQTGEIAVKGRNLTLGYWRNPELTEAKLVRDSIAGDEQIYFTGDVGRRMSDGMIIHLGRLDLMVKVRGYRVDISEIERALLTHRQIQEAAVLAWDRDSGDKRLVAYIVCHPKPAPTVNELYEFLRDKLPDYMLPASYLFMDSLPFTNGKPDRMALPEPDNSRPALPAPPVLPRNSIEDRLIKIWVEVLGIEEIGIHDNFFELGGHSLAASRVVSRVIEAFQLELSIEALFDLPTVADMAVIIADNQSSQTEYEIIDRVVSKLELLSDEEAERIFADQMAAVDAALDTVHFNERATELSLTKQALLKSRLKRENVRGAVELKIPVRRRRNSAPLSFAQQRLWFLKQLAPESPSYNLCSAYQISGPLDVGALEKSFNEIIKRHEILRTVFKTANGQAVQVICPFMSLLLPVIDLRKIESDFDKQSEIRRLSVLEAQRPFDFAHGPLLRVTLLRLTDDRYVLLRAVHHIIFDGWSVGVLNSELSMLYKSFTTRLPSQLPELSIQHADFAVWQRGWLQGEVLETQLAYWKKQLEQVPTLRLFTDRPRPAVQTSHGARQHFELSETLSEGLSNLSKRHGATLFMVLVTAFQTLLHRYTGQDDVAIGSPVAGRNRRELENLLGFFLNTLVLRADLSDNPTFLELLARARSMCMGAWLHQDIPFEKLVEELNPARDLSRHPLIQVTFAFQNTPQCPLALSSLEVGDFKIETGIAIFDLHLFMVETEGRLQGYFVYNTDLFDAATITRLIGHFQTLLEGIVADPEQPISQLPILSQIERHPLINECNNTARKFPKNQCSHQLFETQVDKTPDAVALVFEDQHLTYRELNSRANQLAHYLRRFGVGPEVLVGICVERSIEMIVGLLGILKAGGAYVPIDPDFPPERIEFMLQDSQATLLLTQARLNDLTASFTGLRIALDRDWHEIATESADNFGLQQDPENLAYVIYTSGSTGEPKGVMIQHSSVANFLASLAREPGLTETDILLAVTTLSFDIAGLEIYLPLTVGARVVLARREVAIDSVRLAKLLSDSGVTVMQATPATWRMLLASGWQGNRELKILCGGEALSEDIAEQLVSRSASLWNMYGPTETTIWSAVHRIPANPGRIVLGRPIANTQVYILDQYLAPTPIGVAGEIYIGGAGLARGYLNQPELTKERFIANPFSSDTISRLYKTGDLARYLPDGNIEFLGRTDHQVKIRGYRIELGEIEATLRQHSSIRESVILAREDSPGERRLVAYVVAAPGSTPSANEVRSFFQQKLTDYMVPSAYVFLEALPLTPNGKVDRSALPAPDQSRPELDETFAEPRTPIEELLANIWVDVLKLDKVGIHDNFFDLGGHSLLATQVMSRLTKAFQAELPLRSLFEAPTVAGLAKRIEESRRGKMGSLVLPLLPMPRSENIPLSFAQQRLWILDRLEPNSSTYNIPSALRLKGPLDTDALEQSLNEIVRRHEALRTTFSMVEGQPVQRIALSLSLPLSMIDLSQFPQSQREDEARRLTNEEAQRHFDLERGPLARSVLLHLGNEDHILLLTLHHIAADGWSMSILHRELSALYQASSNGKRSPLETLPVQYADFAQWQRERLQGDVLATELGYWKKRLENIQTLQMPTDRPRPRIQSFRGARQSVELSSELTRGLKTLSRKEGVTLYMTLLAAFQTLLHRYTSQDDIVVGSPIANRNRIEIEGLIGFFVNTLVLRTDHSGNPTFRELLHRVRETALEAYAHQDLPFEKLVEELRPDRDLSRSPLFQAMFVLQNTSARELNLDRKGLTATSVSIDSETAKFDLLLALRESKFGLRGTLEYDTDLFDSTTIDRMLAQFETLLRGIVANPDQRLLQLPLLVDRERHQLLAEWNEATQEYPKHLCVHQLFETQAETRPDEIAIVFEDQQMTYRELDIGSNQLAHYLRKHGVGTESLVGVCLERSPEMIVAVLAILKAGGAYLPLDPSYPLERVGLMVEQAGASIILTQKSLVSRIPTGETVCHCLDSLDQFLAQEKQERLSSFSSPENAAYVLFTSGSTGVPKGVLMEHRPLVNLLSWQAETFASPGVARTLQFAPLSFDVSFQEIFSALCFGGTLVMIGEAERRDATALWPLLKEKAVERMFLPFIALQQLAEAAQNDAVAIESLREIITAGEQLQVTQPITNLFGRLPDCRLYNQYGPTESHVVTSFALGSDPGDWPNLPPIGRPIANSKVYILDRCLQPVPIGVIGELYIGGDSLARGYLSHSDFSREKFISNPFIKEPGARLYRTGDLARYLADGNIQFVGRIDDQVKVRGFRIEPGEIETILCRHPEVLESVVSAREDGIGEKSLVAYIVSGTDHDLNSGRLWDFLKEKLPEYMIPNAFVFLDSLPLTASGKVDRRALAAPDGSRPDLAAAYLAPRNRTEELLAKIWAEVLKLERIGIHDNFFDLGGHSLLATRVASRIREALRIELPLRAMFETPTVAGLSNHIEAPRCARDEYRREIREAVDQTEETIV
jgi:amino acid adenylation domain-containing protein